MQIVVGVLGAVIVAIVLWDAFEAIILPRRVARKIRLTRIFFVATWIVWSWAARRIRRPKRRDALLALYGPLSLLMLLVVWAVGLVLGFGLMQWGIGSHLATHGEHPGLLIDIYLSGTTFFTLGYGDVVPDTSFARVVAVVEAGFGFGFLAVVIGYLPVIYQSFSRREVSITLLDARAGSPSTAIELFRRATETGRLDALGDFFLEWERWSADLLESHLSYPVLSFYRSQHDNQSWLGALTMMLDAAALVVSGVVKGPSAQAQLTFAISRHAVVDLSQSLNIPPVLPSRERLTDEDLERAAAILGIPPPADCNRKNLLELRMLYEPYVNALAKRLMFTLPGWLPPERVVSNWQTSAWGGRAAPDLMREDVHAD